MPLAGMARRLTAMLIQLWTPNMIVIPAATKRQNGSWLREASQRPRSTMKPKKAISAMQATMPNSSPVTAKMKSVWASGRMRLYTPSPGPAPEPAAGENALERGVDLKGVDHAAGGVGVDEAQHALVNVRRKLVGGEPAGDADPADADHPEPVQPGDEEQRGPDDRHQHGLSEVGLEDQRRDGQRQQ